MALALAAAGANAARAAGPAGVAECPSYALSQPFLPWADLSRYYLGPGGAMEDGFSGWTRSGRASAVADNESYFVHARADQRSLQLLEGSWAQTPQFCVTIFSPLTRLFVRNVGSSAGALRVDLVYTRPDGQRAWARVATLTGGGSWRPSPQILFLQGIAPIVGGRGQTWVSLRFTPVGYGAAWRIDDWYVDPLKIQ